MWDHATLYESESGFLNELSLTGRYHGRYWHAETESAHGDDWEHRRIRAGLKGRFWRNFDFNVQADIRTATSEHYGGLTDAYIRWRPSKAFSLTLGKEPVDFTYEGSISSNSLVTFERSLLVNTLWPNPEYLTGAVIGGQIGHFIYHAGVYAGDQELEFSKFKAGLGYLGTIGYDFAEATGLDTGVVKFNFWFNDGHARNTAFRAFESTASLNVAVKKGRGGLAADVIAATSLDHDNDVWGFILLPTFDLTSKLQLTGRYQFAHSSRDDGLSAASRYEREVGGGTGDTYHAMYLGMNYSLHGDKLRLLSGVEYARLSNDLSEGYEGWTVLAGVNVSF